MPSFRCSLCGINYPYHNDFRKCQIHDEDTELLREVEPDENWQERAKALYLRLLDAKYRPFPKVEGVEIHEEHGMLWVAHSDLLRAGFRPSVLAGGKVNGYPALFEIGGKVYEIQGWDERTRRWWIEYVGEPFPWIEQPQEARVG